MNKDQKTSARRSRPGVWAGAFALAAFSLAACSKKPSAQANAAAPSAPITAAATAAAQKPAAPAPKPPETFAELGKGMKLARLLGIVESVSPSQGMVEVKLRSGALKSFEVLSDSKLDEGRKDRAIALAGVKLKERVRVVYAGKYVKSLHVITLASAK